MELAQVHHLPAGAQVGQRCSDTGDVVRRNTDQRGIAGFRRVELDRAGDVAGQVVMCQLNGFGSRRGARGEQHNPDVIGIGELRGASAVCAADVNSSEVTTAYPHQSPRRGTRRQRPPAVPLLLEMTVSSNPDRVSDPLSEAIACATRNHGTAERAVETTKRVLNLHLERAVLASIDHAPTVEEQSFQTEDFRKIVTRRNAAKN